MCVILRVLARPLWSLPSRFGKSGCSASLLAPNPSAVCPAGLPSLLGHTHCSHQPLPRDTPRSATACPSPASLPPTAALRSLRPRQVPSRCQCRENSLPAFSALSFRSPVLGCRACEDEDGSSPSLGLPRHLLGSVPVLTFQTFC